jgi:hypothetical protein
MKGPPNIGFRCEHCRSSREVYWSPAMPMPRFCSVACQNAWQRARLHDTKTCEQCGVLFERPLARSTRQWARRRWCSRQCASVALRGTHGACETPEYHSWASMLSRCYNANAKEFPNWGGRGITVCDRWRHSFENFLADMGKRPSMAHSLDRFPDKNGNYELSNCRWATPLEQARNTRRQRSVEYLGRTLGLSEWVEILGLDYDRAKRKLRRGLPAIEAFEGRVPA